MSALACFAILNGAYVTGSDSSAIPDKKLLDDIGVKSYVGSRPDIAKNADILIYTNAVREDDCEVVGCRNSGIPVIARQDFLAMVAGSYRDTIAVAGAHGKTTTTSMLSAIFMKADYPFASHIGGYSLDIGGNCYHKGNALFVTEACEYKKSFLSLSPTLGIILNMDRDHPDTYRNDNELLEAFTYFALKSKLTLSYGEFSDKICAYEQMVTFGWSDKYDFYPSNINANSNEKYNFDLCLKGHTLIEGISLPIPGRHNVINAVAAAAAASMWGIDKNIIKAALNGYRGVARRFELVGAFNGTEIITDYAHHPTEIKAVINTARRMTKGKLKVIFEPHTYSRTAAFMEGFSHCFEEADELIILPTYAAREIAAGGADSLELAERVNNPQPIYAEDYYKARELILNDIDSNDKILVIGAGTVNKLAAMLVERPIA